MRGVCGEVRVQFETVDLLGFSIGSLVAQEIALIRPAVVRRLILASSAPQGAAGMHGWAPDVIGAISGASPNPDGHLGVFFTPSPESQQSGAETLARLAGRKGDRDKPTTWPPGATRRRLRLGHSESQSAAGLVPQAQVKIYPDPPHGFLFQHHEAFATDVDVFLTAR
jgi:pimeloyl-ACP methyl ester carboxylesterase